LATTIPLRLALALLIFFDLKARREESWLEQPYPEYASYQKRVKKLVPWL
jgi:protein-S-isoprenylcysteine O-methyltransferase Ste14